MKRRFIASLVAMTVFACTFTVPTVAHADAAKVVTIGKDLTDKQKEKMYTYFGVKPDQVEVIEVNNQEERKYLEKVATEQQIGKKTYSCAYIEPTKEGSGINAKIANLNWLTSNMLASALTTAGVYDCNVVAAAPMQVSGTGALTGVMKAFEKVKKEKIDDSKKKLATKELVTTGDIGQEINNKDAAAGIITETKAAVIKNKVDAKDEKKIKEIIEEVSKKYDVTLNETQTNKVTDVMKGVAEQDYDYKDFESTFEKVAGNISEKLDVNVNLNKTVDNAKEETTGFFASIGNFFEKIGTGIADFFSGIGDWFVEVFTGKKAESSDASKNESGDAKEDKDSKENKDSKEGKDAGILDNTNDKALGGDAYIDSTNKGTINEQKDDSGKGKKEDTGIPEAQESHVDTKKDSSQKDNNKKQEETKQDTKKSE